MKYKDLLERKSHARMRKIKREDLEKNEEVKLIKAYENNIRNLPDRKC